MTAKIQDSEVAIFHSELAMVRWLMSGQTMDRTAFPVPAPEMPLRLTTIRQRRRCMMRVDSGPDCKYKAAGVSVV